MTLFTLDADNNITAFTTPEDAAEAVATGELHFASQKELYKLAAEWPGSRLVAIWNGFAGVAPFDSLKPVKKFTDRNQGVSRIWNAIQKLAPNANDAPQGAPVAPEAAAATKDATAQNKAPKAKKGAKDASPKKQAKPAGNKAAKEPREGSKKAIVIALLERKGGATMAQIAKATDWQPHSIRGFISGQLTKKMGLVVESIKNESGDRTYKLGK
jgi:hypothetical protein